jgi:hypothetical protein
MGPAVDDTVQGQGNAGVDAEASQGTGESADNVG